MSFKFFYTDYATDKHVRSDEAISETLDTVIGHMQRMLKEPDNFIGLIDENNVMLQFMVEEDGSICVDVPMHDRKGSLTKNTNLYESIEIVNGLKEAILFEEFEGLVFKPW